MIILGSNCVIAYYTRWYAAYSILTYYLCLSLHYTTLNFTISKQISKQILENSYNCDRIRENVHSSHIQFFNFGDSQNLFGMMERCETFTDCRLLFLYHSQKFHI